VIKTPLVFDESPGRSCPLHYRYSPGVFARRADAGLSGLETLYVAGGLYGNEHALEVLLRLFERERGHAALVFNGDFHWFDTDPRVFERVQRAVLAHVAIRGNVETELASETADEQAGCGCAYPAWVDGRTVARSNRIISRLRASAPSPLRARLAGLPMHLRAEVGGMQVAIVHGDAASLAGWGFSQEEMRTRDGQERIAEWFETARVDAFACTHTCLPIYQRFAAGDGLERWVLNNGAAGMPNFRGDLAGLVTRVSVRPFEGRGRRFGARRGDIHMDAIAIEPNADAVMRAFLAQWPEGSDAHASYHARLTHGPDYALSQAMRL
jgi:hypothetical protein